jgi:serralysin
MFVKDSKAQDREDRIVYDRTSGALSYDADGTVTAAPVKIASLGKNLKLAHQDFFVV